MAGKQSDVEATTVSGSENDTTVDGISESSEVNQRFQDELDLVDIIASQVSRSIDNCVDFDELLAAGREGLFEAARRFEPSRGVAFRTFANYRVEGAIIDAVRKSMQLPRRAYERLVAMEAYSRVAQGDTDYALKVGNSDFWDRDTDKFFVDHLAAAMTSAAASLPIQAELESLPDDLVSSNPEDACGKNEVFAFVRDACSALDSQEQDAIRLCYVDGLSFSEMAEAMNVSKAWAHRVHSRAMDRLTKKMRRNYGAFPIE